MAEPFGDARIEELMLLSEIDREGPIVRRPETGPWRDLVAFLIDARFVNDLLLEWDQHRHEIMTGQTAPAGQTYLEVQNHKLRMESLSKLLAGEEIHLKLTHRGRVRLSELKQALRTGREREPFGILWDVRHWEQDVQIAILAARADSPLALAYLDMNGLKQVNDTHGHDAGDLALKTYFQAVSSVLGDRGEAYRLSGGADEVLVVLPDHDEQAAIEIVRLACTKLMNERLSPADASSLLSIAAGIITSTDPAASPARLRAAADEEQKRAKQRSRGTPPRPSVIAINRKEDMIVIGHDVKVG
jgi:diguanylate cyclase (GGDEF)-like protein